MSAAATLTAISNTTIPTSAAASAAANPAVHVAVSKASTTAYVLYRLARTYTRNTRITPIATYLAYKASGYADTGGVAGMTISDFVAVWTPYNFESGRKKGKGTRAATGAKGSVPVAGTKPETGKIIVQAEQRDARPARQSVKWSRRRRHFCRQEGCERCEL